jgi:hypothetical protein
LPDAEPACPVGSVRVRALVAAAVVMTAVFSSRDSSAKDASIAIGEVVAPSSGFAVDILDLRNAALAEIGEMSPTKLPWRPVVVSLALTRAIADGPVVVNVNATVRDAKTGMMLAIIEAGSHAEGTGSAALRKQVASAAVRNAVRRIPTALKK